VEWETITFWAEEIVCANVPQQKPAQRGHEGDLGRTDTPGKGKRLFFDSGLKVMASVPSPTFPLEYFHSRIVFKS